MAPFSRGFSAAFARRRRAAEAFLDAGDGRTIGSVTDFNCPETGDGAWGLVDLPCCLRLRRPDPISNEFGMRLPLGCSNPNASVFRTRSTSSRKPKFRGSKSDARLASCLPTSPRNPAVVTFHLGNDLVDDRHGCAGRLKRLGCAILTVPRARARKQVLGVDKSAAGLTEALRRLLLAKAKHVDALLTDAGREPGKITVRRNQTKSIEPTAVQQVHGVDDQGDVGRILAGRIGKLLLGYDGVLGQRVRRCPGAGIGEFP